MMINPYLWLRGKRRIRHGYCPKCNSSPPDFECTVCRGDNRYGTNASRTQKWLWTRRYRYYLKHRRGLMPGWGEAKGSGSVGTTGQIEEAHRELDEIGIEPGPLASRAVKAAVLIAYLKRAGKKHDVDL